ncbi:MAG: hypothetical protein F6J93_26995 [Oscillatoria sp. SIO1A7]|nr:hypothetical protein [Oscillatoria sp. SIO1A7]
MDATSWESGVGKRPSKDLWRQELYDRIEQGFVFLAEIIDRDAVAPTFFNWSWAKHLLGLTQVVNSISIYRSALLAPYI